VTDGVKFECYLNLVPGALFWFAPLQRNRTRSPSRKVGASASSMSAIGPKRTSIAAPHMSAFGGKADIDGVQRWHSTRGVVGLILIAADATEREHRKW
jgi:hypothetical protein